MRISERGGAQLSTSMASVLLSAFQAVTISSWDSGNAAWRGVASFSLEGSHITGRVLLDDYVVPEAWLASPSSDAILS